MSVCINIYVYILYGCCRLEKVNMKSLHSQGKILGTVVTLGGAMIMSLIKGPTLGLPWTKESSLHQSSTSSANPHDSIMGSLMIAAGCFCWACFIILQVRTIYWFKYFYFVSYSSYYYLFYDAHCLVY